MDLAEIVTDLRARGAVCPWIDSSVGPPSILEVVYFWDKTRLKIRCLNYGPAIIERAERLAKCQRSLAGSKINTEGYRYAKSADRKPSLKRPNRSRSIAQQFLDDGEKDNWKAYDELYKYAP